MKRKAERVGKTYLHFMNRNTKPKSKCLLHIFSHALTVKSKSRSGSPTSKKATESRSAHQKDRSDPAVPPRSPSFSLAPSTLNTKLEAKCKTKWTIKMSEKQRNPP
jgi:hypothetical protein